MWNSQVGALLGGTTICLFDGNPAGAGSGANADWSTLWRFVGLSGATFFGSGAAFYASCLKADVKPMQVANLSRLRAIGSTEVHPLLTAWLANIIFLAGAVVVTLRVQK